MTGKRTRSISSPTEAVEKGARHRQLMASEPKTLVYRLRRLPEYVDRLSAVGILCKALGDIRPEDVRIASLALTADPWERPPTRTATLTFAIAPALVQSPSDDSGWKIPVLGLDSPLILDRHFFGITPLNDVPESRHTHDCIAISGLASHPFGSWQPRGGDKSFMWIRDAMPLCHPGTRFVLYGYDSSLVGSSSSQTIKDLAGTLVSALRANGWASPTVKPFMFLAHSLGGVILKQALVMMAGGGEPERHMLTMAKGAMLFGVPSKGMVTSHLLAMVSGQPNQVLITDLSEESSYLRKLEAQFEGISLVQKLKLIWVFETKESRTPVAMPDGSFSRSSRTQVILVSKESATNDFYASEPGSALQIDEDHSDMVKFGEGDHRLTIIASKISDIEREGWQEPQDASTTPRHPSTDKPEQDLRVVQDEDSVWHDIADPTQGITEDPDSQTPCVFWDLKKALNSLRPMDGSSRIKQIENAKEHTFEWIFDDEAVGFPSWLRDGQDMFWISGKPGSGKSTMMKYIYNDSRTKQLLRRFGSKQLHLTPAFFFHHRGDVLQKSFEGLLRGILVQLLEEMPDLQSILLDIFKSTYLERVVADNLGYLSADLTAFFQKCHQNVDWDLENAINSLVFHVRKCQDDAAEIFGVFGGFLSGLADAEQVDQVRAELDSCRHKFFGLERPDDVRDAVTMTCGRLGISPKSEFPSLMQRWKDRSNLAQLTRQLMMRRGAANLGPSDQDKSELLRDIEQKQRRREEVRNEIQAKGWTKDFLERVLLDLLNQSMANLDITIFIDAVDEYDGRPEFISTFLRDLVQHTSAMTRIRICCSSRPWKDFTEKFGTGPGFRIHEHTENDIRQYCSGTINYSLSSARLLDEMVPDIVQKANGVFLWVKLVLEHLNQVALKEGDNADVRLLAKLRKTLDSLPDQLEDFYQTIVGRIPESLRWDAYVILEILARSQKVLTPLKVLHILEYSMARDPAVAQMKVQHLSDLTERAISTRLKVRTGGLVEVFGKDLVQVMHQTVNEFVQGREFKYQVLGNRGKVTWENGHSFLAWYYCGLKHGKREEFAFHARMSEQTTGRSQFDLLSTDCCWGLCRDRLLVDFKPGFGVAQPINMTMEGPDITEFGDYRLAEVDLKHMPLHLGLYFGLRIFLKDALVADSHAFDYLLASTVLVNAMSEGVQDADEVIDLVKFILQLGYHTTASEAGDLALALLQKSRSIVDERQAMYDCLVLGLACWDNVDLRIAWTDRYFSGDIQGTGTLLHLSTPQLAEYLLDRGANPNARSDEGLTPLDRVVENEAGFYDLEEKHSLVRQLVQAGGKFSKATRSHVQHLLRQMKDANLDTDFVGTAGIRFPDWIHNETTPPDGRGWRLFGRLR